MGVRVEFADEGERLIARPEGRMDADDGMAFAADVEQRLHSATKSVGVDLRQLDFVSLGGVRAILQLARSLRASGKDLEFLAGSEAVRETLHQAGLNHFFAFTPPYTAHRGHHDETP